MKFVTIVLVLFISKYSQGAVDDILSRCCVAGSEWASRADGCDSYPTAVPGVPEQDQPNCRAILEVCCMKGKQMKQCDLGLANALESPVCTTSNVFGNEQYMECCHCCRLGLAQRDVGGDCNYLSDQAFGGPCDQKFKQCCVGASVNETETDIDECELYPQRLCSHRCVNTPGSYRCECNPGYVLGSDKSTCILLSQGGLTCLLYNPCDHRCVEDANGVQCECNTGYKLNDDGVTCSDINECTNGEARCSEITECVNTPGGFQCEPVPQRQCPINYRWDANTGRCEQIIPDCPNGSYYNANTRRCEVEVSCPTGFTFDVLSGQCQDVNECVMNRHNCHGTYMMCLNTPGSFACSCQEGYKFYPKYRSCWDIDECASNTDTCLSSQRCENTVGSFVCRRILGCGTGYTLDAETQRCVDTDECELDTHNCGSGYNCFNIQGSFRCVPNQCQQGYRFSASTGRCERIECRPGFVADRRGLCVDSNECERPDICSKNELCVNTYGSYRCQSAITCRTGFEVNPDTNLCVDIDECDTGAHDCKEDQTCINRPGSFICDCPRGYRNDQSGFCQDIDECVGNIMCPFNAQCENTVGSYHCVCNDGLRSRGRRCIDINECEDPNRCQHGCINVYGSYHCQCNSGYQLADDKRSCEDINECTEYGARTRLCGGNCINTQGSYRCSCPEGWKSVGGGRSCKDIDECRERPGICQSPNKVCFNTKGSYKCPRVVCPTGFVKTPLGPRRNRYTYYTNYDRSFTPRGRLLAEEGVLCNKKPCGEYDKLCMEDKLRSHTWQFVALPTVKYLSKSVELLNIRPASYLHLPNLRFYIISGNEDGIFEAVNNTISAALNLVKPVIGPAEYELTLRLENWNFLGNQLLSSYITHVLIDISKAEWV